MPPLFGFTSEVEAALGQPSDAMNQPFSVPEMAMCRPAKRDQRNCSGNRRMTRASPSRLDLRAGEWVEVKSKEEILSTLDANGQVAAMPFMPEMLQYCGKRFRVGKRAHKTCDPAVGIIGRKLEGAVHLENLRCSGAAHDGCEAGCLIFWKEDWLKRVEPSTAPAAPVAAVNGDAAGGAGFTEADLYAKVKTPAVPGDSGSTYMCQNTQVKFATVPLRWWDVRQYIEDYVTGNVAVSEIAKALAYTAFRTVAEAGLGFGTAMRWLYDEFQRLTGGTPYPLRRFGVRDGVPTPKERLDLNVGELVRVKPYPEILKTLDSRYRNRGLYFDPDYVPFTGREFRVARRVSQIIDERDGRMIQLKSDVVILDSVVCEAKYAICRRFCPRAIIPYWREIWLERVPVTPTAKD
jgi:hypothetical protein